MQSGFQVHQVTAAINRLGNRPVTEIIRQARQGVMRRRVDEVASLVGLTDKEMARILNMSVRSLHSKTATEPLTLAAGERLLLLERLVQDGLSTFDGRADLLTRWLRTPLAELAYRENINPTTDGSPELPMNTLSVYQLGSFGQPDSLTAGRPATAVPDTAVAEAGATDTVVAQSPLTVLDTVSGFSLAEDVLGRIEWGIVG
jgi:uncharacterized protein (DUF2384 family)